MGKDEKAITFEDLEKSGRPLQELLCKKGHPYMTIIITYDAIKIVEDVKYCPNGIKRE